MAWAWILEGILIVCKVTSNQSVVRLLVSPVGKENIHRGIIVREPESNVYILLWVDHHDEAYAWAKRKKCSINKLTGSVQIFDVQEVIEEHSTIDEPALFAGISDNVFEKIGLPEEQLPMIKAIKTLEGLRSMKAAIPEDAFEGLEWLGNGFTVDEVLSTLYPETEHVDVTVSYTHLTLPTN